MARLIIAFDVTGFSQDEINALTGEALVQGEASDDHGEAPAIHLVTEDDAIIISKRTVGEACAESLRTQLTCKVPSALGHARDIAANIATVINLSGKEIE